ncbi:exodeoxyribonuclease VII large subunit [Sphingomonas kaistensis]|uniref:Exodeoxyribonuclease 7 large subunit n=1 Tax=Sphingomonas kaistensis TaxID=298708 RepID=A0ABZ2FZP9_9SPHN
MTEFDMPSGLLAERSQGDNSPAMSVGDLASAVKRTVEDRFGRIRVRGEISGWKRHSSGHCYFTLKDDAACIDAVIWRGQAGSLAFRPEDGAEVIATAKMTTYPARSKYQLVVERMELAGEGALMALLERRRKALAAEGLFDAARKRSLPFMPRVIGVITSPTGAVIRDILHRLADRCPTRVIVWPVPVQGDGAAAKIAAAIRGFASYETRPDLLIVARGGGSIEDLWAFNEEEVVRAAAESPIPLISAVGHETDTTLIDHASDLRAPTPTAAAEIAVPVRAELLALLDELSARKRRCLGKRASDARERLALTTGRWPAADTLLGPKRQRLDDTAERLPRGLAARAHKAEALMNLTASRLRPDLLAQKLARASDRLQASAKMLPLVHPDRPLGRGFVRVTAAADGRTLTHAADARAAGRLLLRFGDGEVAATTGEGPPPPPPKVERSPKRPYAPPQPNLFD